LWDGVIRTALGLQGVPYRWGGSDLNGFDCSGFTQYVFAAHGVGLPREVTDQYRVGRAIEAQEIRPGDLLFFSTTEAGASHVAISLGSGEFVHAPSSTGVVRIERLGSEYWSRRFLGARRLE
jgi:cell wall-associated NlpC family hydrolase